MFSPIKVAVVSIILAAKLNPVLAQAPVAAPRPVRPPPPTRDPNTPGYVTAKELPDGAVPPINANGNFIIGPTHTAAPEMTVMTVQEGVPQGIVFNFTMESTDSKFYPGIARDPNPTLSRSLQACGWLELKSRC